MSKRVKCFARLANLKISALSMGKSPFPGLDLGKTTFHLIALSEHSRVVIK